MDTSIPRSFLSLELFPNEFALQHKNKSHLLAGRSVAGILNYQGQDLSDLCSLLQEYFL